MLTIQLPGGQSTRDTPFFCMMYFALQLYTQHSHTVALNALSWSAATKAAMQEQEAYQEVSSAFLDE